MSAIIYMDKVVELVGLYRKGLMEHKNVNEELFSENEMLKDKIQNMEQGKSSTFIDTQVLQSLIKQAELDFRDMNLSRPTSGKRAKTRK